MFITYFTVKYLAYFTVKSLAKGNTGECLENRQYKEARLYQTGG